MDCIAWYKAWVALVFVTQIAVTSAAALPPVPIIGGTANQVFDVLCKQGVDILCKPGSTPSPDSWVTASPTANPTTTSQLLTTVSPTASPTSETSISLPWWFYIIIGFLVVVLLIAIAIVIKALKGRAGRMEFPENTLTKYSQSQHFDEENELKTIASNDNTVKDAHNHEHTGDGSKLQIPPVVGNGQQAPTAMS